MTAADGWSPAGERVEQRSAATALAWMRQGRRVAVGLLCAVEGSTPLDAGRMLFATAEADVEGSITGGCVESEVVREALAVLTGDGRPRLRRYGISDELAGSAGLTCGGIVHVLIQRAGLDDEALVRYLEAQVADAPAAMATLLDGDAAGARVTVDGAGAVDVGMPAVELLRTNVEKDASIAIDRGRSLLRRYGADGAQLGADLRVQFSTHALPAQMVIVGAIDFAAALAPMARALGFAVTIVDPRTAFLASPRFASADTDGRWPDAAIADRELGEHDAVLVFTHDAKLDTPALTAALRSGAGYVGALGSRRTTEERGRRLRAAGVDDADLARLHAPCGLDLGAATPEETAVAILAEIVAERTGRSGRPLREGDGTIRVRG